MSEAVSERKRTPWNAGNKSMARATCEHCGIDFVYYTKANKGRFCKIDCARAASSRIVKEGHARTPGRTAKNDDETLRQAWQRYLDGGFRTMAQMCKALGYTEKNPPERLFPLIGRDEVRETVRRLELERRALPKSRTGADGELVLLSDQELRALFDQWVASSLMCKAFWKALPSPKPSYSNLLKLFRGKFTADHDAHVARLRETVKRSGRYTDEQVRGWFRAWVDSGLPLSEVELEGNPGRATVTRLFKERIPEEYAASSPRATGGGYTKGRAFEYRCADVLKGFGFYVLRSAGSKGSADLIGVKAGRPLLVQCKRNKASQPKRLPRSEREAFIAACQIAGATGIVAFYDNKTRKVVWREPNGELVDIISFCANFGVAE